MILDFYITLALIFYTVTTYAIFFAVMSYANTLLYSILHPPSLLSHSPSQKRILKSLQLHGGSTKSEISQRTADSFRSVREDMDLLVRRGEVVLMVQGTPGQGQGIGPASNHYALSLLL